MPLDLPLDLDLVGSWRPWPRMDGRLQALGHETPPHATDGREADIQGRDDLLSVQRGPAGPSSPRSKIRAWTSFRAAALPEDTMRSSACRSSTVRVTLYFSTGVLLPLAQSRLMGSRKVGPAQPVN